jgi:CubicO group peptidase (beta-lactamase class C family)
MKRGLSLLISTVIILMGLGNSMIATAAEEIQKLPSEQYDMIEEYVNREMEASHIPGVAIGIVHGDEIVYTKGFGVTDQKKSPVTVDTPFYIGSVGKTFTALAIRQLQGEGKLYPNAAVTEYIPWFTLADNTGGQITIEDLLEHTSGLSKVSGNAAYSYHNNDTIEEVVKEINQRESINRPVGSSYEYSNLNYVILGLIIEKASGLSYTDYITQRIFEPMKFEDSYLNEEEAVQGGLSQGYRELYGFNVPIDSVYPTGQVPAGYQLSSITDMSRYVIYFLNNGYAEGVSILPNNQLKPVEDSMKVYGASDSYYSLDWGITDDRAFQDYNRFYGFLGATSNFNSAMLLSQVHRYGIIVLVNQRGNYRKPELMSQVMGNGISDILLHNRIPAPYKRTYDNKLLIMPLLVLLLSITSILSCIRFGTRLGLRRTKHSIAVVIMVIINIAVPILLLIGAPIFYDNSWKYFLNNGIDTGLPIFVLCMVLLITGIIKLMILWKCVHNTPKDTI